MSREIKFEYGFESVNGIVKKVYSLSEIPIISHKCDVWNVLPLVYVREFTGQKDKKETDIYDGDIVEITINGYGTKPLKIKYLIVYHIDGFQGCNLLKKYRSAFENKEFLAMPKRFNYNEWSKMEKIGNIHENPELLTKTH